MAQPHQPRPEQPSEQEPAPGTNAVAVISAYGAFRVLLILLAIWTFIEGFALFTGGIEALTLGGEDRAAERIVGAHMIVLAPVYGLLAWRRDRYRLLIWIPYAAQLAIIVPLAWSLVIDDGGRFDGFLLLIVSIIFLVLLVYFWVSSHPAEFFRPAEEEVAPEEEEFEEGDEEYAEDEEDAEAGVPEDEDVAPRRDESRQRPRRYRRK